MSGIWKNNIGLSIFGESHGACVGITLTGVEPGFKLDLEFIQSELDRRKPGTNDMVTQRVESDKFELLSGVFNGNTTGAPITMIIKNENMISRDYDGIKDRLRPGHADFTAKVKYNNFHDYRGGGHFSGRLTAGIVFAGAVAKDILLKKGIQIGTQITSIGPIRDDELSDIITLSDLENLKDSFPVVNDQKKGLMKKAIRDAKAELDSLGGTIRCFAIGVPVGLGDPYFESFESVLSSLVFSVPAIKGLNFGSGIKLATMKGSEANDAYYLEDKIKTRTNHNGGILGGITNGMPIDFSVVVKPTPSISKKQESVDFETMTSTELQVVGRHDPCIVPRVLPVLESVLALTILDRI